MKKVFFCIPCYNMDLDFKTVTSMLSAFVDGQEMGFQIHVAFRPGDALVQKARNVLLGEFLATDCTDFFTVDSDISWGPGAFGRMVMHPVDFVCGCYRVKSETLNYFVRPTNNRFERNPEHGLMEVEAAPTGFMRVSRKAIEQMQAFVGPEAYFTDHAALHLEKIPTLFDCAFEDHLLWGEDYIFCRYYRRSGGKVWVDPDLMLLHTGKFSYAGRLIDALSQMRQEQLTRQQVLQGDNLKVLETLNPRLAQQCADLIAQHEAEQCVP